MKPSDSTTVRIFGLLVVLLEVLLVVWACWSVQTRHRIVHSPSLTGGGESTPTTVTARRLSVRNVSTTTVRFSKLGLFASEDDAKRNRNDLLAPNQSTIRLYTNGFTPFLGSAIAWSTDVYDAVSVEHFVSLLPNTALVLEWLTDVSFSVVRLGVFDATPDPRPCRLKWETGTGSQPITSATFTPMFLTFASGDVQNQTFLNADGTHIAPNGMYTASLITFSDIQSKAAADKAAADKATADKAAAEANKTVVLTNVPNVSKRIAYQRNRGVTSPSNAVKVSTSNYPNHNIFRITERPPMMQKSNFLFSLVIDSDALPTQGSVTIAQIMVNVDDPGDPSIVYDSAQGGFYGTEQWNANTTQTVAVSKGGVLRVTYLSDQTNNNAYISVFNDNTNTNSVARAKCAGVWATGSDDTGKLHIMCHTCVQQADLWWSDDAMSTPVSSTPCLSSL
jgi:hypothetical protein